MYCRYISAILVALFATINSPVVVNGQSVDSLMYLIDNELVKDDSAKYAILSKVIRSQTDLKRNLEYCDQAIELAVKLNIVPAQIYVIKGRYFIDLGSSALALECLMKAANYYKEQGNNSGLAMTYLYIAEAFNLKENFDNAKLYLRNASELFKREKDSVRFAFTQTNLGYTYYSMEHYDSALNIFVQTAEMYKKQDLLKEYAYCIGNSGLVYSKLSDFDRAEENLINAIEILTELGDERAITEYMIEYADILYHKGEIKKAISCAARGFNSAVMHGFKEYERNAAKTLTMLYEISGRCDSAFFYQSLYIMANDSINNIKDIQKTANIRTEYELSEKQTEVELLEKNKLFQRIVILGLVVILLLAMGLILLYYSSLRRSRKLMAALDERRIMLENQSLELREKNDTIIMANEELKQLYEITSAQKEEIISSINYAERIQKAVLPPEAYITELINEHFIFYKPKEIVSGDFYWIKQINHYIILAAADCTGHGVPGAFMSMLGISCLNEIVQRKEITQANQVLNELRKNIKHSLRQTGKKEESRDGIDMALCVIDTNTSIMQYSGAYNPLYIISHDDGRPILREVKADKMPVGVHVSSDKSFTNHEIQLEIGDTFYISTDGFIDQIGGSNHTRFRRKKFKELLLDIYDKHLFEQKEMLEQTLKDWMGDNPQRDDILVIGARL